MLYNNTSMISFNIHTFILPFLHCVFLLASFCMATVRKHLQRMSDKCNGGGFIWSRAVFSTLVCTHNAGELEMPITYWQLDAHWDVHRWNGSLFVIRTESTPISPMWKKSWPVSCWTFASYLRCCQRNNVTLSVISRFGRSHSVLWRRSSSTDCGLTPSWTYFCRAMLSKSGLKARL